MTSQLIPIAPWMLRRQRLLHGLMLFIDQRAEHGKMRGLYRRAANRFNRSILAMKRGCSLGHHAMRNHYRRWLAHGKKAEIFSPKWKRPGRLISPEMMVMYADICRREGLSPTGLFRRLQKESGPLYFSIHTLRRQLPVQELLRLTKAKRAVVIAERGVIQAIAAKTKGTTA